MKVPKVPAGAMKDPPRGEDLGARIAVEEDRTRALELEIRALRFDVRALTKRKGSRG